MSGKVCGAGVVNAIVATGALVGASVGVSALLVGCGVFVTTVVLVAAEVLAATGVLVAVRVFVATGVLVAVGVFVATETPVAVGVFVATEVFVAVGVSVAIEVPVAVGVFVATGALVSVGVLVIAVVSVAVGVFVATEVSVAVGVAAWTHAALETVLVSNVTAPLRARALPDIWARVFRVMLVSATMFPANDVSVPRVAELVICQNTLQLEPPLLKTTDELLAVVSALPILKTHTALPLPWASRVSIPVNPADDPRQ